MDEKYELRITASTKIGEGNPAISHKLLIKTGTSMICMYLGKSHPIRFYEWGKCENWKLVINGKIAVQSAIISFGMEFRVVWKTDLRLPCEFM